MTIYDIKNSQHMTSQQTRVWLFTHFCVSESIVQKCQLASSAGVYCASMFLWLYWCMCVCVFVFSCEVISGVLFAVDHLTASFALNSFLCNSWADPVTDDSSQLLLLKRFSGRWNLIGNVKSCFRWFIPFLCHMLCSTKLSLVASSSSKYKIHPRKVVSYSHAIVH